MRYLLERVKMVLAVTAILCVGIISVIVIMWLKVQLLKIFIGM